MNFNAGKFFGILLFSSLLLSCAGQGRSIPVNVNNLFVSTFQNQSSESALERILTDDVIQEFSADGRVEIVSRSDADAILRGSIIRYRNIPVVYNDQDIVEQFKVRMGISVSLIDPRTQETLWTQSDLFRETTYSETQPPVETESDAQERVSEQLARNVVTRAIDGWPYVED